MADFNRRDAVLKGPAERRSRFGDLGDRLTKAFSKPEHPRTRPSGPKTRALADHPDERPREVAWDEPLPRFPIARQGYDPGAVDEHIAELEQELMDLDRELAEVRARTPAKGAVAAEMERIGEQTSAILIAAHEQAKEITSRAQEQADRCIADAASNAVTTTADAQRQLRDMENEKVSLSGERERLIEDIRTLAGSLSSLADGAADRFPSSPEHGGPVTAAGSRSGAASQPADGSQTPGPWQPALVSEPDEMPGSEDQPTLADLREG